MKKLSTILMGLIILGTGIGVGFSFRTSSFPALAQAGCQTFPATGKTVCGRFLQYWQTHGGLAQQGYPISGEFTEVSDLNGQPYTVQYFERAVFEKHPENAAPNDVLLSQLGTFQFKKKYPNGEPGGQQPPPAPPPTGEQPISFNGTTTLKTTSFHLNGGNYASTWTAKDSGTFGCYVGITLKSTDPSIFFLELIANKALGAGGSDGGTTQLYNVKAGDYYFDVNSTCSWGVTLTHQ